MLSLQSEGHEICVHGNWCSDKVPDIGGITIAYSGGSSLVTATVYDDNGDSLADRLVLLVNNNPNHVDSVEYDLTSGLYDRISRKLASAIDSKLNYSTTVQAADSGGGASRYLKTGIYDLSFQPAVIPLDIESKYYGEISEPRAILESAGIEISTFIPPGHALTDDMRNYLVTEGFSGSRGGTWTGSLGYSTGTYLIEAAKPYDIMVYTMDVIANSTPTPSEEQVRERLGDLIDMMGTRGGVCCLYAHTFEKFSFVGWQRVLKVLYDSGVKVMTLGEAVDYLRTYDPSGDIAYYESDQITPATSVDAMYVTRTLVDNRDFELRSGSAMVGGGISVAAVHEQPIPAKGMNGLFEHFLYDGVDVGAYPSADQNKNVGETSFMPTGYDVRGTIGSPAQITLPSGMVGIDTSGLALNEPLSLILNGPVSDGTNVVLQSNHKLYESIVDGAVLMYYPHIASDNIWETEVCLINSSSSNVLNGILRAYNSNGDEVSQCLIINLVPHARRQLIIGNEFSKPDGISYLAFEGNSDDFCGYTKFYVNGWSRVAVPAVTKINAGEIYVSHIASDFNWWTGLSLVNTGFTQKNINIEFDNGQNKVISLFAREHLAFTIADLFENMKQSDIHSATITGAAGLIGLELFGGGAQLSGILLNDQTKKNIYYPHVAGGDWWTGIVAYNPSLSSSVLSINPYTEDGVPLSMQSYVMDGHSKFIGTIDNIGLPDGTAWFKLGAENDITGLELFGSSNENQLAGYSGAGIAKNQGVFAKIEKNGWTGIAFVNVSEDDANIILTAYNDLGEVVANESMIVGGHVKSACTPENLFTPDISRATYITYSSDQKVVGFQLNGSFDGMMLDALPGL